MPKRVKNTITLWVLCYLCLQVAANVCPILRAAVRTTFQYAPAHGYSSSGHYRAGCHRLPVSLFACSYRPENQEQRQRGEKGKSNIRGKCGRAEEVMLSHLPEAVTGDIDHGVVVGARHRCCLKLHSVCRAWKNKNINSCEYDEYNVTTESKTNNYMENLHLQTITSRAKCHTSEKYNKLVHQTIS